MNHFVKPFCLLLLLALTFGVQAQEQSLLLPIPGDVEPDPTGSRCINFSNPANPTISQLPAHTFYISPGISGDPHSESDLFAFASLMNEYYLGQHPAFAQSLVHDPYGNLLFFIVDNNIYNRHGVAFPKKTFPEDAPGPGYAYLHDGAPDHS